MTDDKRPERPVTEAGEARKRLAGLYFEDVVPGKAFIDYTVADCRQLLSYWAGQAAGQREAGEAGSAELRRRERQSS